MFKKVLSVVVSLALIVCLLPAGVISLPVSAATAGDYTYFVSASKASVTGYTGAGGDVVIPSKLGGYPVTSIGAEAFSWCSSLTGVTIPDGVTSIGGGAFSGCRNLLSLTIPNSVTSIGSWAFASCSNLISLTIPNSVTSIGEWAFFGCSALTSITIPKNVMSVGECAFAYCGSLKQITVDADNPYYCSTQNCLIEKSSKMLIAGTDTSVIPADGSVTGIGSAAFARSENLDSITIPECVTYIAMDAFYRCTGLQSIEVAPNNSYYCAAGNCLVEIASKTLILGCDNSVIPTDGSVTCIGMSAFEGCSGLTVIVVPDSVTSIGDGAFSDCSSLTSITIPDSVTSIGSSAFYACERLTDVWYDGSEVDRAAVYVGSNNEELLSATWHYAKYVPTINYTVADGEATITGYIGASRDVVLPDLIDGYPVTSIGAYAFSGCSNLATVTIGNGVTSIESYAFFNCSNLVSVTIPNSVTSIESFAFSDCINLASITIPNSLTRIEAKTFSGCSSLTSITIPNSVTWVFKGAFSGCSNLVDVWYNGTETEKAAMWFTTDNDNLVNATWHYADEVDTDESDFEYTVENGEATVTDYTGAGGDVVIPFTLGGYPVTGVGENAFCGCSNLVSITMPSSVTNIGYAAFSECGNLTTVILPDSVVNIGDWAFAYCKLSSITIPEKTISIGEHAFDFCKLLTSITIPDSVTSIGAGAFAWCNNLTTVNFSMNVTQLETALFMGCSSITSFTIPNGVTSIEGNAFYECKKLDSIVIPDSVTQIGDWAFEDCDNLSDVYYGGTQADKAAMSIGSDNDDLLSATWHYAGEPNNPSEPDEPVIDENAPQFVVEDVTAKAGDTVTVAVKVKNNPGIVSTKLEIGYDANVLELISGEWQDFTDGVSGFSPTTVNPFVVNWANTLSGNNATDGVLALLTFKVKDGAVAGDTVITVSYDPDDVYDENWDNVSFATVAGTVTVIEYISGDANDDGKVNNKDLGLLLQYLNKWDVTVVEAACDVNRDGKVNNKDLGLLLQYLNGWDVELK